MADTKISALPASTAATASEVPCAQGGATKKIAFTAAGAAVAEAANAAAQRTALGLGTAATTAASTYATASQGTKADSAVQPSDLGTAAVEDVGVSAGNVVQLDVSAKLPAVDGSQLTNLPAAGTIPSTTNLIKGDGAGNGADSGFAPNVLDAFPIWTCTDTAGANPLTGEFSVNSTTNPTSIKVHNTSKHGEAWTAFMSDLKNGSFLSVGDGVSSWCFQLNTDASAAGAVVTLSGILLGPQANSGRFTIGIDYRIAFFPLSGPTNANIPVFNDGITSGQLVSLNIRGGIIISFDVIP